MKDKHEEKRVQGEIRFIYVLAIVIILTVIIFVLLLRPRPKPVVNIPPVADFTWSVDSLTGDNVEPQENEVVQFIDNSYDPDGHIVSWLWDFGDNTRSTEQNPTHRYLRDGEYTVTLLVTDNAGENATKTKVIRVRPSGIPRAFFIFSPPHPTVLDTLQFIDNSYDPDGHIVSWLWDFGDGTFSRSQNPTHIFHAAGSYRVILTVVDNDGNEGRFETIVSVSLPPSELIYIIYWDGGMGEDIGAPARYGHPNNGQHLSLLEIQTGGWESDPDKAWKFIYSNISGGWAGFYCEFTSGPKNLSDYENLVFWVKGERGGEDFEIILEDIYGTGGKVRVSDYAHITTSWRRVVIPLGAFGEDLSNIRVPWNIAFSDGITGKNVTVYIDYIILVKRVSVVGAPVARFTYSPTSPTTSDTIQFIDNSYDPDGHIVRWIWDFGDGTSSTDRNPTHRYLNPGSYTVTLTVIDNSGTSASCRLTIVVSSPISPPPPPPPPPPGVVTLSGIPSAVNIPRTGSVTITNILLNNSTSETKTLKVICDAWDASGGKLWSNIYTMDGQNVFVNGVIYPLVLAPGSSRYLKLTVGGTSTAQPGETFTLHIVVEDY
ncbi:MAG: PKD domain-containing protein [Candidatus Hadarchaeales archaeon]